MKLNNRLYKRINNLGITDSKAAIIFNFCFYAEN